MSFSMDILNETAWTKPNDYMGHNPKGHYVIYSRHRESTIMENVNYRLICEELKAVDDDFTAPVYTFRAGHWGVGWVEYIIVRNDAPEKTLETASDIICSLSDYPILNEDAYSLEQFLSIEDWWHGETVRERASWCLEIGESIFAARRDYPSPEMFDHLSQSEMFY